MSISDLIKQTIDQIVKGAKLVETQLCSEIKFDIALNAKGKVASKKDKEGCRIQFSVYGRT